MMNDPITKVMQDASEIVRYDEVGIPLYIREGLLSSYPDHRALCHWHEDIEWKKSPFKRRGGDYRQFPPDALRIF